MTVNTNVGPQYQLTFAYDAQGRRIQKLVSSNSVAVYTNRFLFDGWNLVAVLNPSSSLVDSFMWGSDLSGSQQGAGGVGGLLEVSYSGTNCFVTYDGNGNVAALVNAADGTTVANYEYGAFGEPIRMTGAMAKVNPFRFSTKCDDDESDLLYYGHRYYKPSTGTWPNRDPQQERGGLNLYGFIGNNSENIFDLLGLSTGTIEVFGKPLVADSFGFHARGWDIHLKWTAPSDGDWAKPCSCKPCQRAVWLQEYIDNPNDPWQPDITQTSFHNWSNYGNAWGCAGVPPGGIASNDNNYTADVFDTPQIDAGSIFRLWWENHDFFEALSYVKCIEGKDAGKVYGSVKWGFTWSYDSTPTPIGPFIR